MTPSEKTSRLQDARQELEGIRQRIGREIGRTERAIVRDTEELRGEIESQETRMIQAALIQHSRRQLEELRRLLPSPYFTRCDVHFEDQERPERLRFGKFSFEKDGIVSWTSPIAAMRFEEPGPVSYRTPEDGLRAGTLCRKDQYMIVDGKILFLASEATDYPRELVYQDYLTSRQGAFILPEIVAQMEKAQDQVIRADHAGPLVISGPAGSGKTTLALHRVAYLTQSPDTARYYPSQTILVFVQDTGTKDYFSHLLPELGIHNVRITTFSEWAFERLQTQSLSFVSRIGDGERERDEYEYAKIGALRSWPALRFRRNSPLATLRAAYAPHLTPAQHDLLERQCAAGEVDRIDLTLLLLAASGSAGFEQIYDSSVRQANGRMKRVIKNVPLEYSLLVIDEFQNYLPEQLRLFAGCANRRFRSILYVGDLAQQTQFGTVRDWQEIHERIEAERAVRLEKVYRNTAQILEYIRRLGYQVEVPEGIRQGPAVVEKIQTFQEEMAYLQVLVKATPGRSVGILAKDGDYLWAYRHEFRSLDTVHCLSIREAQGVEFDIVCLVGVNPTGFAALEGTDSFAVERSRINRDLLYVALTRAMSELHVLGTSRLC